jgi:hypothetical protein
MNIKILNESGYKEALLGLSLSYGQPISKMGSVADKLFNKDGGHNKFLESIQVWIDITAARYWWQQFDTYRIGVTKQSESTMHTIMKDFLTQDNFEGCIDSEILRILNDYIRIKEFDNLKRTLPESFLQRRIVCTNYKTLRHIIKQRHNHKLIEWKWFCYAMLVDFEHTFLVKDLNYLVLKNESDFEYTYSDGFYSFVDKIK